MAVVFCRQNLAIPTLCDTSAFGLRNAIARERGIAAYRAWLPFERIRPVNIPQGRGLGRRRSVTALYSFSGPDLVWQAYKNCWLAVSISLLSANAGALKQARCPLWIIFYRSIRFGLPVDVRFAPKAT